MRGKQKKNKKTTRLCPDGGQPGGGSCQGVDEREGGAAHSGACGVRAQGDATTKHKFQ